MIEEEKTIELNIEELKEEQLDEFYKLVNWAMAGFMIFLGIIYMVVGSLLKYLKVDLAVIIGVMFLMAISYALLMGIAFKIKEGEKIKQTLLDIEKTNGGED